MSRSGYTEDCEDMGLLGLYRGTVKRSIRGRRGQAFLRELAEKMDAMPKKILISDKLIDDQGSCCAIGVVCKARGLDVSGIDYNDPQAVGNLVNISRSMAAEIEFENDGEWSYASQESPWTRWNRMRKWVRDNLILSV